MTIDIVTGGAGFIGSHLANTLIEQGREVWIIDRSHKVNIKAARNIQKDIATSEIELPEKCRVFHLAGMADIIPSIKNPRAYYEANVTGTLNVLESARKAGCIKFIYTASASCYGDMVFSDYPNCSELRPRDPKYPYALTKYLGEQLAIHWSEVYEMSVSSMRLFNVYGSGHRTGGAYGGMFGTFLAQLANMNKLTVVGDGTQSRDFIHVSDVVNALITAADRPASGIYNVGSGYPTSVNQIINLLGSPETVNIPKRPGEPDTVYADISKIKRELGWQPKVGIEEGIAELLTHLSDYKDAPLWTPEMIAEETKEWFARLG